MKKKMLLITVCLGIGFAIFLPLLAITQNAIIETAAITVGVTLYHFIMRLTIGTAVNIIMKNKANYENLWFREKSFESKLYKLIGVRKWKKHLPTYAPDTFDTKANTVSDLIGATCQAEIIHEIIMLLSLLPMVLIPILGGAAALIITSVFAMLIDSAFVILQRYNRPKLVKIVKRFHKI